MNTTATSATDGLPTWAIAVAAVGAFVGLLIVIIVTYIVMIYCQLTTGKRFKAKKLFSRTDCCSVCCLGLAERCLRCCCVGNAKLMKELDDEDAESLVSDQANEAGLVAGAVRANGGNTSMVNVMHPH